MINIFMDATVFACPRMDNENEHSKNAFEEFIENILAWRSIEEASWCNVFQSGKTAEALFESGRYPLWDDLAHAITRLGLSENYQAKDVVNLVDGLLGRLQFMEDHLQIAEVLIEQFSVAPRTECELDKRLAVHLEHVLSLVAVADTVGFMPATPCYVANSVYDRSISDVTVSGEVAIWETTHAGALEIQLPFAIAARVLLTISRAHVERSINVPLLCAACTDENLFRDLLQIAISREAENQVGSLTWEFGKSFFSSAKTLHMFSDPTKTRGLVETCVDAVLNRRLNHIHRLRENAGANSPARKRGNSFALRRDIDHEFHIHYWGDDRHCELAQVVVHGDFTIPT